jgi:hypothetical protein
MVEATQRGSQMLGESIDCIHESNVVQEEKKQNFKSLC